MPQPPRNTQKHKTPRFNVVVVAQAGRLQYEALLFAASLRHTNPGFKGRLFIAEPQSGPRWESDPTLRSPELRAAFARLDAEILPFESRHFGSRYPNGNKIEALTALPAGEPFVFFDSDTLITGDLSEVPFDFNRPSASMRREATWPRIELYGPGYTETWKSLYDMFGLDFESSLDHSQPEEYWRRHLYFNAGFFYYHCPHSFGERFLDYALRIEQSPPEALICQPLYPWLDQIALPLVIHSFGGGRDALPTGYLDGRTSCHYRFIPLLYARTPDSVVSLLETIAAPNWLKKHLKPYEPLKRLLYQGKGHKIRALFDQANLPPREQAIRKKIKDAGLWMR